MALRKWTLAKVDLRKWTWLILSAPNPERRLPAAPIFDHSANFSLIQTTWSFIKPMPGSAAANGRAARKSPLPCSSGTTRSPALPRP